MKRLSILLLLGVAIYLLLSVTIYFVNAVVELRGYNSYSVGYAFGTALGKTITSPVVWLLAMGSLICFVLSNRTNPSS